ncbi:MAG: DUF362 domain-containing protein [Methanosarcinaceae archaeon]|nr:DUF362 domain-containing protein [Methanosarcinaceae archaeon]
MSNVSIVRCPDYSNVKEAIAEALDLLGGLDKIISRGDLVLLKPNIIAALPPEAAATTHPAVVAAMCEFVLEAGGVPVVGDGAGISRPGATAKALKVTGIEAAALKAGAKVINFETAGYMEVEVPAPLQFPKLYLAKPVLEADVVISLPKLKTHELTYYTGAVKNFFGALPLKMRKEAHLLGERELFGEAVADIYSVIKPHFALMDGVLGMEGNGPSHGTPVNSGLVLAAFDCVALDIVAAGLIGFDPLQVPTTAGALKKGYGDPNPRVLGASPESVRIKFEPSAGGVTTLPPFLTRHMGKFFSIKPRIEQRKCTRCGACYLNCSPQAVEKQEDGSFRINEDRCILCYCCRELCPNDAVEMKKSLLAKFLTLKE